MSITNLSFEQFLAEELNIPNLKDGLNKRRHTLPQLKNFDEFKADLDKNRIGLSEPKSFSAKELAPTQSNFNEEKVRGMIDSGSWNTKPIIVSNDDYVIDGHHRWLAASEENKKIMARVVDMTAEDLLAFLKDKEYVEKHTIQQ